MAGRRPQWAALVLGMALILALTLAPGAAPLAQARSFEPNPTPQVQGAEGTGAQPDMEEGADAAATTEGGSADGPFVFDEYGLFTESQRQQLEQEAQSQAERYGMGVYLLTCSYMDGYANPTSSQRTAFATTFYRANDLGLGSGKDGIMLVVAVASRDYVTIAYGQGSYSFSDEGIEAMEDAVTAQLADDQWFAGAQAYYSEIGQQLAHYQRTGKPYEPGALLWLIVRIVLAVAIAAAVAGIALASQRRKMRTAVAGTQADLYLDPASLALTETNDAFVTTTMMVVPRAQASSGGSGGGGGWGGGGGGGFSSSGGGKF